MSPMFIFWWRCGMIQVLLSSSLSKCGWWQSPPTRGPFINVRRSPTPAVKQSSLCSSIFTLPLSSLHFYTHSFTHWPGAAIVFSLTPLDLPVKDADFRFWRFKCDSETCCRILLDARRFYATDLRSGFILGFEASIAVGSEQLVGQLFRQTRWRTGLIGCRLLTFLHPVQHEKINNM